ncbi:MAG: hypothetical protein SCALA702_09640 [Melioribacteraceae bacterium]|nr:MAG: hypothetical protein SCALA702_09640 [Melioribacteraceae bacterium]
MKKYIATFVAGFGAAALQVVPGAKALGCCLIIPLAAFIALSLDQKANNDYSRISVNKAILFGVLTGVVSAFFLSLFDVMITLITHNNEFVDSIYNLDEAFSVLNFPPELKKEVGELFYSMRDDIVEDGFSFLYTFSVFTRNFIIDPIFGLIGGLVSMQIINKKNEKKEDYYG